MTRKPKELFAGWSDGTGRESARKGDGVRHGGAYGAHVDLSGLAASKSLTAAATKKAAAQPVSPSGAHARRASPGFLISPKNRHPAVVRDTLALARIGLRSRRVRLPRAHYFALRGLLGTRKHSEQLLQEYDQ
jgi:hypothetical protein